MSLNGIDVSNVNGTFDWSPYSNGEIQFAAIKISEGLNFADGQAARNIEKARSLGLAVIGYHFIRASLGGAPQARWFLQCAKAAGIKAGDGMAYDSEDEGLDNFPVAHMDLVSAGFSNEAFNHTQARPFCYTEISMASELDHCGLSPLWLANPSGSPVTAIGPWSMVSMEQVGQRGVDTDVFYGTQAELAKLAIPRALA